MITSEQHPCQPTDAEQSNTPQSTAGVVVAGSGGENFAAAENFEEKSAAVPPLNNSTRFYRIILGSLCFGALVRGGIVVSVPPAAGKWRGQNAVKFIRHYKGRGARIERLGADGKPLQPELALDKALDNEVAELTMHLTHGTAEG